jgi:hypothetical protein
MNWLQDNYLAYKNRQLKRKLLRDGVIENRRELLWDYTVNGKAGQVKAFNRSEANARVKDLLGIKERLPKEAIVTLNENH